MSLHGPLSRKIKQILWHWHSVCIFLLCLLWQQKWSCEVLKHGNKCYYFNILVCICTLVAKFSGMVSIAPPCLWNGRMASFLCNVKEKTCVFVPPYRPWKLFLRLIYCLYSASAKNLGLGSISSRTSPIEACFIRHTHIHKAILIRSSVYLNCLLSPRAYGRCNIQTSDRLCN